MNLSTNLKLKKKKANLLLFLIKLKISTYSILVSIIAACTYFLTLAPTYSWGDSSDFTIRLQVGNFSPSESFSWEATSRDYDIFEKVLSVFRYLPIVPIEARANLASAFFGAVSVGLTTYLAGIISNSRRVAVLAGVILLVSHTFWLLSVVAEVYTFTLVLLLALYINVEKYYQTGSNKYLMFMGLLTGLIISHHSLGIIAACSQLPVLSSIINKKYFRKILIWSTSTFIASIIYLKSFFEKMLSGEEFLIALGVSLPSNTYFQVNLFEEVTRYFMFMVYNFPIIVLLLLALKSMKFTNLRNLSMREYALFAFITSIVGISSTIPDKYNIYVLVYPYIAVLVSRKVSQFMRLLKVPLVKFASITCILAIVSPIIYWSTYKTANIFNINLSQARTLQERDNNKYFLWPPKQNDFGPKVLTDRIMQELPANAILLVDYTIYMPLKYEQFVANKRTDVTLAFIEQVLPNGLYDFVLKNSDHRVFLAANTPPNYYGLDNLDERLEVSQKDSIFELKLVG